MIPATRVRVLAVLSARPVLVAALGQDGLDALAVALVRAIDPDDDMALRAELAASSGTGWISGRAAA